MAMTLRLLLLLAVAEVALCGLNATWIGPTLGCNTTMEYGQCSQAGACARQTFKLEMGETLRFSLAATNPTPTQIPGESVVHCTGNVDTAPGCHPVVIERLQGGTIDCCNFSSISAAMVYGSLLPLGAGNTFSGMPGGGTIVKDVNPSTHNITRLDVTWVTPAPELVAVETVPLFKLSYVARYGASNNLGLQPYMNTSTCNGMGKEIVVRLCMDPTFAVLQGSFMHMGAKRMHVLSSPSFYRTQSATIMHPVENMACGFSTAHPCFSPAFMVNGRMVATLSLSPPSSPEVASWAVSDYVTRDQSMAAIGVRVGQNVNFLLRARSSNDGEMLGFKIMGDPGLPIGMAVSTEPEPCFGVSMCWNLSWTPRKGQEGRVHEAVFVAMGPETSPDPMNCTGQTSVPFSVRIPVTVPVSTWEGGHNMGEGDGIVGTTFARHLVCKSNYRPLVSFVPASGGPGVAGGGRGGEAGMMGATLRLHSSMPVQGGNTISTFEFAYTPMRGDEGGVKSWTFSCGDDQMVDHSVVTTVTVMLIPSFSLSPHHGFIFPTSTIAPMCAMRESPPTHPYSHLLPPLFLLGACWKPSPKPSSPQMQKSQVLNAKCVIVHCAGAN
jgi:hypothetical protein